jgi:hypothetical protein
MGVAAEPALVILAAVALVALWERLFADRTTTVMRHGYPVVRRRSWKHGYPVARRRS